MQLNEIGEEEDVLSYFTWNTDRSLLFGMIMRIHKNDTTQGIPSELYSRMSFSISDIDGAEGIDTCKGFYYIALNNDFLVTSLAGNIPINRVETYLNYLVQEHRKGIYDLVPIMILPNQVPLSEIKKITVGNEVSLQASSDRVGSTLKSLSKEIVAHLLGSNPELTELTEKDIIKADLIIRFKKKPNDMSKEEYQSLLGKMAHPLANDNGITIETKQGRRISGEEIRREKRIVVDRTETGRYNEVNLMQEMERFINELELE